MSDNTINGREELALLLYPTRYDIYLTLKNSTEPLYPAKIAQMLGISRKLASFHLSTLEEHGFATSEYGLSSPMSPPKAVRYYTLTDKGERIIQNFIEEMEK